MLVLFAASSRSSAVKPTQPTMHWIFLASYPMSRDVSHDPENSRETHSLNRACRLFRRPIRAPMIRLTRHHRLLVAPGLYESELKYEVKPQGLYGTRRDGSVLLPDRK